MRLYLALQNMTFDIPFMNLMRLAQDSESHMDCDCNIQKRSLTHVRNLACATVAATLWTDPCCVEIVLWKLMMHYYAAYN